MDKRAFQRIPAHIEVKFYCNKMDYTGTITNISENGMFISTKEMCSPFDSQFEVSIATREETLKVPVNLSRIILSPDSQDGIGVQISDSMPQYVDFVRDLRAAVTAE